MIVMDENGNAIDYLEERNKKIKENLQPILEEFLEKEKRYLSAKKNINLGYSFLQQLQVEFMEQPPLSFEQTTMIDGEMLWDIWLHYCKLMAFYNRYFEIVHNKQIFCMYCGINDSVFSKWEESEDDKIKTLIKYINTNYVGNGWVAGESGNAPQAAIKERLRAKNVGHNVISASEELIAKQTAQLTPSDIAREIEQITGVKALITGDKK